MHLMIYIILHYLILLDASTLNPNLSFKTHESYSDKMKLKDVIEIVN